MVGRDQSVFTWGDQLLEAIGDAGILAGVESSTVLGSGLVRWGVDPHWQGAIIRINRRDLPVCLAW